MVDAEHNMNFLWDLVFFKVEETIFARPRGEFERSSEVFADMFRLPSGSPEGRDKEHPIILEGYKAEEFNCLLKVMYPTSYSLISGTNIDLHLVKEEWISILKLSTIWNMSQIREYAIHRLSTDLTLVPIEKIQLARAHKVSKWLEEGIVSLVNGDHRLTRKDLPTLGYDMAASVLLIRDQLPQSGALQINKNSIKCAKCSSSDTLLKGNHTCHNCRRILVEDEEFSLLPGSIVAGIPSEQLVSFASIQYLAQIIILMLEWHRRK
ncbi:hypothetical protein CPB84DRAFT_1790220 [Gymnopilus junonius]|uniref:BTB domain-containing protein n=1 Tax=Gymnopilus junonius TaxID=109634 RepID=A0A9P5NG05_GYMJU|nr:hypothetical protein CPB84DRAFT_1790220 [Gymnopilus junonius]